MNADWAAENLHVIRTLMERSVLYRRALTPIMVTIGTIGLIAGLIGWHYRLNSPRGFGLYWFTVGCAGILSAFLLVRKQAFKAREAFWSSPTRRVAQAAAPCLFIGFIANVCLVFADATASPAGLIWWLVPLWMALYGSALHAAGFFIPRGIKVLGLIFLASASSLVLARLFIQDTPDPRYAHLVMGLFFGGFQLIYGFYLKLTKATPEP